MRIYGSSSGQISGFNQHKTVSAARSQEAAVPSEIIDLLAISAAAAEGVAQNGGRIQDLKLQFERGTYNPPSQAVAANLIKGALR